MRPRLRPTSTETPIERGSVTGVTGRRQARERIGSSSVAGRSHWRATTARTRASRSRRSPTGSVARRRRSRRTSTTRLAIRRGRSRPATRACAAAAAPTRSRATARATPTRTARRCHPGAIERRWTRERVLDAMLRMARALRPAAVVLRLVAHARAPAWGRCARAARGKRVAISERRYRAVRNMGRRLRSGAASGGGRPSGTDLMRSQRFCRFGGRRRSGSRLSGLGFGDERN